VTRYLYDGDDLLMELDGAGNPIREYTYYPAVDRPHSLRSGGHTYYSATDNPGHVVGLVNGANQVVNKYYCIPWHGCSTAEVFRSKRFSRGYRRMFADRQRQR
jgi:hypothetical protein